MTTPSIIISYEMLDDALRPIPATIAKRSITSLFDSPAGHLGEFAFAQWYFGDWRKHRVGKNKGKDYGTIQNGHNDHSFR